MSARTAPIDIGAQAGSQSRKNDPTFFGGNGRLTQEILAGLAANARRIGCDLSGEVQDYDLVVAMAKSRARRNADPRYGGA
ncbi:hypothetical protein C5688_12065 [Methylocystis sp. MitZ-2018]|nr:hypothetical protein C5688_12065 [Methylocystis sp. MitZ-2018]